MSNPFVRKIEPNSPVFVLSALALVLGLMIGFAFVTQQARVSRQGAISPEKNGIFSGPSLEVQENYIKLQSEVNTLREQLAKYERAASREDSDAKLLQQSLQTYKIAAGLTELTGPGVTVTLKDTSQKDFDMPLQEGIIHDIDVLRVVNELNAAGAEAVAVNGQRVVAGTAIRCVGPVVHVNFVSCASPIRVMAIGDTKTLIGALGTPGGVIDDIKLTDPNMVSIEKVDKMTLPAYSGTTTKKLAVASEEGEKP